MNPPISVDFTNVVDQGKQLPLDIHLGFRAQGKVIQALVQAEVSKDGLDDRQAPGIDLPALGCVDPGFHLFDQAGIRTIDLDRQKPARGRGLAQTVGTHRTDRTIVLASAIDSIDPVAVALAVRSACQDFALWTAIDLG